MKASGRRGGGATRGLVATTVEAMPNPTPTHCVLLTLLATLPALLAVARTASKGQIGARGVVLPAVAHTALSAFAFGWHVHEKFLIVALLPLALLALSLIHI